ncbi:16S rRNA (guanine(966)-N(2))-methyltransferase RsmD [candidate division KSB1 bacterium]|nr:16S rRNA (guanine(966)-N(2))-methyltransferase RsmD [candidate division KSB1 bacterium]
MRIIAGSHKGRSLISSPNSAIRPTADRTKQILFDHLGIPFRFQRVLDLFAGTGNLGLEALSRGAQQAYFVDRSPAAIALITENCKRLNLYDRCHIIQADVFKILNRLEKKGLTYDLILADPPYQQLLTTRLLQWLDYSSLLAAHGLVVIEQSARDVITDELQHIELRKSKIVGETRFTFFSHRGD